MSGIERFVWQRKIVDKVLYLTMGDMNSIYKLRAYSTRHWLAVPPEYLAGIDPRALPTLDLPHSKKSGSPSFFLMLDYSTAPRIRTHDGPCFKLADQSPKPLDHRNWPIILFLLDLLTASSENIQFGRLILCLW